MEEAAGGSMKRQYPGPRQYKGFTLERNGGHDTPWTAFKPDGPRFRAETLVCLKAIVTDHLPPKGKK